MQKEVCSPSALNSQTTKSIGYLNYQTIWTRECTNKHCGIFELSEQTALKSNKTYCQRLDAVKKRTAIAVLCTKTVHYVQGKDAVPFLEKLVVGDVQGIQNGSGSLTVFTNEQGGIIDDSVVTKVNLIMPGVIMLWTILTIYKAHMQYCATQVCWQCCTFTVKKKKPNTAVESHLAIDNQVCLCSACLVCFYFYLIAITDMSQPRLLRTRSPIESFTKQSVQQHLVASNLRCIDNVWTCQSIEWSEQKVHNIKLPS